MRTLLSTLLVSFSVISASEADENLAADGKSNLPKGDGLAAKFKADAGISEHQSVIYSNGFEQGADWKKHWDEARDKDGKVLSLVAPEGRDLTRFGKRCLQARATLGENL